jgi:class 3 adenylate cyclase
VSVAATRDLARKALEGHVWQEAYERFASLADRQDVTGEDLEGLGEAAWWSAHPQQSIDAFTRACAAYEAEGSPRKAGYAALRLAFEYADRIDSALWNGWIQRASRLLGDQPECVERGYLEIAQSRPAFEHGAIEEAVEHVKRAHEIGMRFADRNLVAFGLALQGAAMVYGGQIREGLALVDEGALAAVGGELMPYAAGAIYCITIGVCRSVADYRRAAEWTDAAAQWCERQAITAFPGVCRVQRAEIKRLRGELAEAEDEARRALTELTAFGRLPQAGAGSYEVGEVRLRLGDLDGAQAAFEQAHELGREPHPGLALVQLARGNVAAARAAIATSLGDAAEPLGRARLLAARVEVALASHDVADALEAVSELQGIASTVDAPMLHAAAHQALGSVLTHQGDADAAIVELRTAVRQWIDVDAPFEAAQARRWLALACRSAGDEGSAAMELRAAKATFERLGARLEAERCDQLIRAGSEADAGRRVTRTFMFTDIVGSTDLIRTIGDDAWKDVLRWHDETLRTLVASHRGEVVHGTGDGFFASFADPAAATDGAVAIQRKLTEHRRRNGFAPQVRIGLHAGDATAIGDDYAGLDVHVAARVGAIAEGGEILATTSTLEGTELPFGIENEREVWLNGLAEPVRVVTIDWRSSG